MSKKSLTDSQDGSQRKPQEYMNDYLAEAENTSNVSQDQQDSEEHYVPSRDFAPQHRISASASYRPRGNSNSGYAVQQVIPNTHMGMGRSGSGTSSGGHSTSYRNRAQSGVSSNHMNLRSVHSTTNSTPVSYTHLDVYKRQSVL